PHPAEIDRELRGERTRRELRQRQALEVVLLLDPAAPLDEVALHVARERDWPAEAEGPEREEVAGEVAQAGADGLNDTPVRCKVHLLHKSVSIASNRSIAG